MFCASRPHVSLRPAAPWELQIESCGHHWKFAKLQTPAIACGSFHGAQKKHQSVRCLRQAKHSAQIPRLEDREVHQSHGDARKAFLAAWMQGSTFHLAVTQELLFPARATTSTVTHGWQSSQIICSTSFSVQLLCSSSFPYAPVNNYDVGHEMLQFDPS